MTNAAVLAWLSQDKPTEENLDDQEARGRAVVEDEGWNLVAVYRGVESRSKEGHVPEQFEQLLTDVEAGRVDVVVARDHDRLGRSKTLDLRWTLANPDIYVYAEDATRRPYATDDLGDEVRRMLGRHYAKQASKNQRQAARRRAEAGRPVAGGLRPFGFEADKVTVRPDEAELIREAARRYLSGESARSIADDWRGRGITTPSGNEWRPSGITRFLQSARLVGRRTYKGQEFDAEWETILDEETRRAVLRKGGKRGPRGPLWVLTGTLVCGECGTGMNSWHHATGRRYRCVSGPGNPGCGRVSVKAEDVEAIIWNAALGRTWDADQADAEAVQQRLDSVLTDLSQTRQRRDKLDADYWQAGTVEEDTYRTQYAALTERISNLETERADLSEERGQLDEWSSAVRLGRHHLDASEAQKRALLARALASVQVAKAQPGKWFDPSRLSLKWKDGETTNGTDHPVASE